MALNNNQSIIYKVIFLPPSIIQAYPWSNSSSFVVAILYQYHLP
jgi:hypothetical protein